MTVKLPGMNCGLCGYRTCEEFMVPLTENPELSKRCIYKRSQEWRGSSSFQYILEKIQITVDFLISFR